MAIGVLLIFSNVIIIHIMFLLIADALYFIYFTITDLMTASAFILVTALLCFALFYFAVFLLYKWVGRRSEQCGYLDTCGCNVDSIYWNCNDYSSSRNDNSTWHNCTAWHNTASRFAISTIT